MHLAKLTAMALIEYHYHMLIINIHVFTAFYQYGKFLNGSDNDVTGWVV